MIKTVLKPMLPLMLAAVLFSCNNGETKEEPKAGDSTSTVKPPDAVPAAFIPFNVLEMDHVVKDYSKWKPLFDSDSTNRKASGLENIVVGRNMDNANDIHIVLMTADIAKAKAFGDDPKLKETMTRGGVISKPEASFWHIIKYNPEPNEKQWVEITHKVKDFAAWLKVYDGEGSATRASNGLLDVALGRGVEDSNMVKIVFDISDMAKAKADISSDAKKKLMMDAGVIGVPKIVFYKRGE